MAADPRTIIRGYAARGWQVLPIHREPGRIDGDKIGASKVPIRDVTPHGFLDATSNLDILNRWLKSRALSSNWAIRCGEVSGITVVDIDHYKPEGAATWAALRADHPQPLETPTLQSGQGGLVLVFRYDDRLKTGKNRLGPGIDIRNDLSYILVPPSRTLKPYEWTLDPDDIPLASVPEWMIEVQEQVRKNGRGLDADPMGWPSRGPMPDPPPTPALDEAFGPRQGDDHQHEHKHEHKPKQEQESDHARDYMLTVKCLALLDPVRADEYDEWYRIGMTLRELGDDGLVLWDEWSKKSTKYKPGDCWAKWQGFSTGESSDLMLGTLVMLAEKDSGENVIDDAPKKIKPHHIKKALARLGWTFQLNLMNGDVHVCGKREDDIIRSVLFDSLAEHGFRGQAMCENAWVTEATLHPFHPIRDYLSRLTWDGADHIGRLCTYIDDGHNTAFNTFFRRWLIGAVARPLAGPDGCQARAFVIDGKQGIGKSRFVRWLGSPLPQFFAESGINTEDKDFLLMLCSTWVWEVSEVGATMRKTDRDALKHFISRQTVRMRKAYGRREIHKPAIASFIPTINNEAGFLSDPTGYRRFMVATVQRFDWAYSKEVDINHVWAQALQLYRDGEAWELTGEESIAAEDISKDYEVDDPLVDHILDYFEIDASFADPKMDLNLEWFVPTSAVLLKLKQHDHIREADRREAMHVGSLLLGLSCRRAQVRINGKPQRGYFGLKRRLPEPVAD